MLGMPFDLFSIAEKLLALAAVLSFIMVFALIVRKKRRQLKYFIGFAILIQLTYIIWRVLFTIPTRNAVGFFFGVLLFLAELVAFVQSTTHRLMFMKDYEQPEKSLDEFDELPTVDILIATYNEPVSILRQTVAAAASQRYPKDKFKVYVCDDGHREEVRQLAEEYGAAWSVRDEHVHAKAGNLNNCLENYASGELFLVLDADMIAKTTFLERTVGHFIDPNVALVQAPQVFYNPDPFQNNLQLYDAIPNEQDFFMREVMTRRSAFNAVLNVGTNALFRRSAIDEIGLIPVGTITEDMATSMLLQAKGFKTIFINETLAMGLSPDTFSDYVIQRDRWCRGNIQVMKKWNPLTLPGLSFMQRLIYFDGVLYWFFGLQKIIYNLGPILFLLTGIPIFYADVFTMLMFFVPTYYIASLVFTMFSHKSRTYAWAHIYESALAPYLFLSAFSELLFARKAGFSVTPKGEAGGRSYYAFKVALPHLILLGFSLTALGLGIHKMLTDVNYMIPVYLVNLFWLLYNMLGIIAALIVCFEKQRVRKDERFIIQEKLLLKLENGEAVPVELIDISLRACAAQPLIPLDDPDSLVGSTVRLAFNWSLEIPGVVFRSRAWGKKLIIQFWELTREQHTQLLNFIFDNQQSGYGSFRVAGSWKTARETLAKFWTALRNRKP
jgi:cellulose synthase (UDP-forming)